MGHLFFYEDRPDGIYVKDHSRCKLKCQYFLLECCSLFYDIFKCQFDFGIVNFILVQFFLILCTG